MPSVRMESPVLTKPHWSFGTVLISAMHVSLVKVRRSTTKSLFLSLKSKLWLASAVVIDTQVFCSGEKIVLRKE